jgi:hypothetical protein
VTAYQGNQAPPGGKHVVSAVPDGPRDLSAALARHRAAPAGPTVPPGGWPVTAGSDPDAPAGIASSDRWTGDPVTSASPAAYSQGSAYTGSGNY